MTVTLTEFSWTRMIAAVEAVRQRALRATSALERAGVEYAVAGGNAVAAWVARVDRAAVRNTQDVDILIRRSDFPAAKAALESSDFVHQLIYGVDCFLDGPEGGVRNAVHILFAGEKVRSNHLFPAADVSESEPADDYRILQLESLVRMKLNSYRDKDRTHLRDLIEIGLVDSSWVKRLPDELSQRLQNLLDTPDG